MVDAVSRELILPAIRLDVPPRPSKQQLAALAERTPDQWATTPLEWATEAVVRLAVAEILKARLAPGPGRSEHRTLSEDPEQVTLAQLASLFRPHVGLSAQAFQLAVVEAVNSHVPAAVDPVREGLRRIGITGREPMRMVALGLDKLPARARQAFWDGVKTSTTVTAVLDGLSSTGKGEQSRSHDVSGLDRSQLARADALVLAAGRITPVLLSSRTAEGSSWLQVPLAVTRRRGGDAPQQQRRGGEPSLEVAVRGDGWVEVFETALDAVGSAMQQIDQGNRPRGRSSDLVDAVATRLVAAKDRTVADVHASLRALDEFALELFDPQVSTSSVPVAVPAVEDDLFVQLWLPTSALAGPLFTGAPDLFLGGAPDYRTPGARPGAKSGERQRSGERGGDRPRGGRGPGEGRRGGAPDQPRTPGEPGQPGGRAARRRKPRPPREGDATRSAGESGGQTDQPTQPTQPTPVQPPDTQLAPPSPAPEPTAPSTAAPTAPAAPPAAPVEPTVIQPTPTPVTPVTPSDSGASDASE